MRKLLFLLTGILVILLAGLSFYYFFLAPKGCKTEIISGQSGLTVKIADRKRWDSFISALTTCNNGQFPVYDLKADQEYFVKNVSYVFTDDEEELISFSNTQTGKVFYRWRIEVDEKQNSAQVFLNLPDIKSDDFDIRLFSSVFANSRRLFDGPLYKEKNAQLAAFTTLEKIGMVYEK